MKIFIIGPGGVGKTTCGRILADLLNYDFIDLDEEFCKRVENVGLYINQNGYDKYYLKNSQIFYEILEQQEKNFIFALSSGFLVHKNLEKRTEAHKKTIKEKGLSILLLPSESMNESCKIIVKRQLSRGFGLKEKTEEIKFVERFPVYKELGDIQIFSQDIPEVVAQKMKHEIMFHSKDSK